MSASTELYFGTYCLRGRQGPLLENGVALKLQPRTLALLWTLASQPGEVITKAALLDAIWPRQVVTDDALTFQIQALRRALRDDPKAPRHVLTAHRVGLRFGVPVTRGDAVAAATVALVGRDAELQVLAQSWEAALAGRGQTLFVTGDTGIGKSALMAGFQQRLATSSPQSLWARGQCLEHTGASEPYLPVLEALGHLLRKAPDGKAIELMRRVAPSWLLQLPNLMEPAEYELLRRQNSGVRKERMLRELAEALEQLSLPQGLLLVIEDLHWADAATLDLIAFMAQRQARSRLLVVGSLRVVDAIVAAHPVRRLQLNLKSRELARELPLLALSAEAVGQYLSQRLAPGLCSAGLPAQVFEHSGGQPLFMVQIAEYLAQHPQQIDALAAQLHELIPEALKDLISLQLNDLVPADVLLLEGASVAGVEFSAAAVSAATGLSLEAVEQQLEQLASPPRFINSTGLSIWPDGTTSGLYRFRHALYAQVLRRQLVDSRRARMHRLIAEQAEVAFGTRSHEIAGELALHFEQGGLRGRALPYRLQTARKAAERAAFDAVRQETERGLKLLDALAEGPARDQAELALRVLAVHGLQSEQGYTTTLADEHFDRLTLLVEGCSDPQLLEIALFCLWVRHHFQCRFDEALRHAERLRALGSHLGSLILEASGDTFAGLTLHLCGRFVEAERHAMRSHQVLDSLDKTHFSRLLDLRMATLSARSLLRWMLGYPEQALKLAEQSRAHAEASGNPYALCMSRVSTLNNLLVYRRDWPLLLVEAAESIKVGELYGHRDSANWARRQYALALAMSGDAAQGLPMLWQQLAVLREKGSLLGLPMDYTLGAECCIALGDFERARWALDAAWSVIREQHTLSFESETRRMEGLMALARGHQVEAESHLLTALHSATARQAPLLQLRAAMSLSALKQRQGLADEALQLLAPLYDRLTEGHDSPDLVQARALLEALRAEVGALPV